MHWRLFAFRLARLPVDLGVVAQSAEPAAAALPGGKGPWGFLAGVPFAFLLPPPLDL